jgi:hypothetical protein
MKKFFNNKITFSKYLILFFLKLNSFSYEIIQIIAFGADQKNLINNLRQVQDYQNCLKINRVYSKFEILFGCNRIYHFE